jgi:hypothetical protein
VSSITNDGDEQVYNACLDMSSNTTTTGCSSIANAGTLTVNGANYAFSFSSLDNLTTSSH